MPVEGIVASLAPMPRELWACACEASWARTQAAASAASSMRPVVLFTALSLGFAVEFQAGRENLAQVGAGGIVEECFCECRLVLRERFIRIGTNNAARAACRQVLDRHVFIFDEVDCGVE